MVVGRDTGENTVGLGTVGNSVSGSVVESTLVQAGTIGQVHIHPAALASTSLTPRQIRSPRTVFVNREAEIAALNEALESSSDRPVVVTCTGLGGVGKTELVARWARDQREHFPDGQLYADLGAVRHSGGVDLGEVLGGFVRALGVREDSIPASMGERANLYRTVTAGRRLLVFLDGVEHAAEARALTPSSGLVVAAGRTRLDALVLEGARPVTVGPLGTGAAGELVRRWLGEDRGTERDVAELVRLCGGLPLALQAVGAQMITRSRMRMERVVAELAERQRSLEPLGIREAGVQEAFESVYAHLPAQSRDLYHLLGMHPGPLFTPDLARAVGLQSVDEALEDLLHAHLVDETAEEDRYRCHDLVRLHARRRAYQAWPEARRDAVLRRIVLFYRDRAAFADREVLGERFRLQPPPGPAPAERLPTGRSSALEWLQSERANLLAVLHAAAEQGWHEPVWQLCESLWPLYHSRKHFADWVESHELGVEAARWDGRADAEIRMHNQLARAHYEMADYPRAQRQLDPAQEQLGRVQDPRLVGMLWESQGLLSLAQGDADRAVHYFTLSLEANSGDPHGTVVQTYNLGQALLAADRHSQALQVLDGAVNAAEDQDDAPMLMRLGLVRSRVLWAMGDPAAALACAQESARLAADLGQVAKEAQAVALVADLAARTGDPQLRVASEARGRQLLQEAGVAPRQDPTARP
jgi:tetratricopeptide (TPR) repeat protein